MDEGDKHKVHWWVSIWKVWHEWQNIYFYLQGIKSYMPGKKDIRQEHSRFLPLFVYKLLKLCLIGLCSVLYQSTCWLKVLKTVTATAEKEGRFSPTNSSVASSQIKRILSKACRLQTRGIRQQRMLLFIHPSFYKLIFSLVFNPSFNFDTKIIHNKC